MNCVYFGQSLHCSECVKIGSTINPVDRLYTYNTCYSKYSFEYLYIIDIIKSICREDVEALFHNIYDKFRTSGAGIEWFKMKPPSKKQLKQILDDYAIKHKFKNVDELERIKRDVIIKQNTLLLKRMERMNTGNIQNIDDTKIVLRGYQIEQYNKIQQYNKKICHFSAFCGGGKTIIYQKWIQDNNPDLCILIIPWKSLIENQATRWQFIIDLNQYKLLIVCSKISLQSTTDIKKIRKYIGQKLFVITTPNSFKKVLQIIDSTKYKKIFVIGDEAHNLCDKSYTKKINVVKSLIDRKHLITKMLFATATPVYGKYKDIKDKNIVVMNNPFYFGDCIKTIKPASLRRLRDEEFLCDYEILLGGIKTSYIGDLDDENKMSLHHDASVCLLKAELRNETHKRKILMYLSKIEYVEQMYIVLTKYFDQKHFKIIRAHSELDSDKNANAIKDFEKKDGEQIKIMVNCRKFCEGINITNLDTVIFCDPKQSVQEIIQIFGRPLRKDRGNPFKIAKIIIPFLYNLEYQDQAKYKKIIDIVMTISLQDEILMNEVKGYGNKTDSRKIIKACAIDNKKYEMRDLDINVFKKYVSGLSTTFSTDEGAILEVLRNGVQKTIDEIFDEINKYNILKSTTEKIETACMRLLLKGLVKKDGVKYYLEYIQKWTTSQFVDHLKSLKIETQDQYNAQYRGEFTDEHPDNPTKIYKDFKWSMILIKKYYTIKECKKALTKIKYSAGYLTGVEKNKLACCQDSRIPPDVVKYYGVDLLDDDIYDFD